MMTVSCGRRRDKNLDERIADDVLRTIGGGSGFMMGRPTSEAMHEQAFMTRHAEIISVIPSLGLL
jgi:hypothetical protein